MPTRDEITDAISDFKRAREAAIEADEADFPHHLRALMRELQSNWLCAEVIQSLPEYDVGAWWSDQTKGVREERVRRIDRLDFPDGKDARFQAYLELARSFASEDKLQVSIHGFGGLFGKHKNADCLTLVLSLVLRPLVDEMTHRLRKIADLVNPDIRELAGVPLARIPGEKDTGIFLSHRSTNKDLVDRYFGVLQELGLSPWYDKDAIPAGATLHRALESGMDQSCAAVFFLTPDFQDERWLGRELDLAMQRKVERGAKFSIISLVFGAAKVPRSLTTYRYANVENDLDGLREIIRGLPTEVGPSRWKEGVADEK